MLQILNINKFMGLYNLQYFSVAVLVSLIFKTTLINNNKINSLQIYDTAQNYGILHKVVQRLSKHNLIIWKYRHIKNLNQRK
jgi:hypothetical protein